MTARFLSVCVALAILAARGAAEETQGLINPVVSVSVSSPVLQEVIEAVQVEEGDTVKMGQPLVKLRSAKEELAVQEGRKLVENAEFVARGSAQLAKESMLSKEQALKSQTELDLARIRMQLAEEQLKEKTIRSPINGIVVKKYKEAGESVDRVEKLLDVVDIDQVLVQFYLSPKYLQTLQIKQPISVRIPDLDNLTLKGEINFLDPRVDASSGLFRVKVLIDNREHKVKAGLKAVADFAKKG